ncbi:MAG: oligoribonuclease [Candidatus Saccharimonadales bacterium]|jgi:oligoribonuclease
MTMEQYDKNQLPSKLLWVDLEMTGLDPVKDVILEISAIITDFNFEKLADYEAVIHQSEKALARMTDWPAQQHKISGLTEKVRQHGRPEAEVQHEVADLIRSNFGSEPAVLAGNSIHFDRMFIRQWWPEVESLLHYRMLDVSSFKVLMQGKYNLSFAKKEVHRAKADIEASIDELKYYLDWLHHGSSNG